jgi:hypothetical protein
MFGRWSESRLVRRIAGLVPTPLSPELRAAVVETGASLTAKVLGPRFRSYRDELVLIFARQLADATMRLSSSHWSSGGGRNVGMDVLQARGRALAALKTLAARRPRDPLDALLRTLDELMIAQRASAGDDDGYGIATLGEIRRDVERLIAAARPA